MFRTAFATLALIVALSPAGHAQMRGGIGQGGFRQGIQHGGGRVNGFGLGAVGGVGFGYGGYGYPGFGGFSYPAYGYDPSYYGYNPGYYYPYNGSYPQSYNATGSLMNSIQGVIGRR